MDKLDVGKLETTPEVDYRTTWVTFKPKLKKIKKIHAEKVSYIFPEKAFLIFQENETLIFQEIKLSTPKNKKVCNKKA